ncbi:MAG: ABC transporter ATP-binding protein [Deltaproteobacteria bacterium]|nr:ABC transporter ATP-binding protein [Deltaproteobacteria bacterium]
MLNVENLTKKFGDFVALDNVSLTIKKKEFTALIGPNGAGKTTLYNVISGKYKPTSGKVIFLGKDIAGIPPHKIAMLGLSRSFQITNIFMNLSVLENVITALIAYYRRGIKFFSPLMKEKHIREEGYNLLELLGLKDKASYNVNTLSYGDKRLIEIAIALAIKPKLLLLDEPTAGMTPEETEKMINLLKSLSEQMNTTFFLTEHDMKVVFSVADKIYVLHQGKLLSSGDRNYIRQDKRVKEAYLGGNFNT